MTKRERERLQRQDRVFAVVANSATAPTLVEIYAAMPTLSQAKIRNALYALSLDNRVIGTRNGGWAPMRFRTGTTS